MRAQYGIDTNEVYPRLILKLLPVGLIGVMIACMVSALTSTLSDIKALYLLCLQWTFISRGGGIQPPAFGARRSSNWTSFIALVVAVLWAPLIGKFASLVAYYQRFSSYLAPPIVGRLVGLFWKGSTRNGAFAV